MSQTPGADVSLSSGAESGSCDEDSDSHFELEGFLGQDEREDDGSDCSGCSTATVRSSPRLALEAAAAAAEAAEAAAWEIEHALPPAPSPLVDSDMEEGRSSGGAESPDAQPEVEFLATTVAVPLQESLTIKENLDLELDAAEKPLWNFTAVDNNLGLDADGQPMTEAHEHRYLQKKRACAENKREYWNGKAGLNDIALLLGLDPSEVAVREVAETEAAAAAAEVVVE
jgi:hypothetical protein